MPINIKPDIIKARETVKRGRPEAQRGWGWGWGRKPPIKIKPNVITTLGCKKVLRNCDSHRRKLEGVTF